MTEIRDQRARAIRFRDLHAAARPLQLANAWDATSARVLAAAGATAIGTTSFGIALNDGVWDGEQLPVERALAVAAAIASAVEVPVTIDLEAGRGRTAADVQRSVAAVIAAGAVGINIEDGIPGQPGTLRDAVGAGRADRGRPDRRHRERHPHLRQRPLRRVLRGARSRTGIGSTTVLRRAEAYQEAGADGLFLPGLLDVATIRTITGQVELPVNIMVGTGAPSLDELADAGVRRLSQGGEPFLAVAGHAEAPHRALPRR